MNRNRKILAWVMACVVLMGGLFAVNYHAIAQAPPSSLGDKSAIIGKIALPATYTTLTTLSGRSSAFLFKGYVVFPSTNAGASNVLKASITGASDVPCAAGDATNFNAVNSDSIIIKGAITDYLSIVGEDVDPLKPNG